jgi:hypothetical protein
MSMMSPPVREGRDASRRKDTTPIAIGYTVIGAPVAFV